MIVLLPFLVAYVVFLVALFAWLVRSTKGRGATHHPRHDPLPTRKPLPPRSPDDRPIIGWIVRDPPRCGTTSRIGEFE